MYEELVLLLKPLKEERKVKCKTKNRPQLNGLRLLGLYAKYNSYILAQTETICNCCICISHTPIIYLLNILANQKVDKLN